MLFKDVAALVIFLLVILFVIVLVLVPVTVKLPTRSKARLRIKQLTISYAAVPVAGAILMLCTGSLTGQTLAKGIVGDPHLKPYGIVILFLALAYISTSLDSTGCLAWLALHITRLSKGNGVALFGLYFGLSSVITALLSNDVSIMTLTPIIYYFSVATSVDPLPFLTAMFTAANIWSMLLFVGNPTNIIVALAYQMTFADYSRWMALPTIGAGLSCLAVLLFVHHKHIPKKLTLPDLQPAVMLVDKPGAVLGSINILACLGLIAAAPTLGWELWIVTAVCAGLHAVYNFVAYVACKGRWCTQQQQQQRSQLELGSVVGGRCERDDVAADLVLDTPQQQEQQQQQQEQQQQQQQEAYFVESQSCRSMPELAPEAAAAAGPRSLRSSSPTAAAAVCKDTRQFNNEDICVRIRPEMEGDALDLSSRSKPWTSSSSSKSSSGDVVATVAPSSSSCGGKSIQELLQVKQPTFWHSWAVLPWEVVPFVLGMFVLVEGLNATGWVDRVALWLADGLHGNIWYALFAVGAFSVLVANLANNQPMTILMTRITMSPAFITAATAGATGVMVDRIPQGAALAVVIASNVAANYTVMGALAGIMYVNILQRKGMNDFSYVRFSRLMLPSGIVGTVVALAILGAEYVTW